MVTDMETETKIVCPKCGADEIRLNGLLLRSGRKVQRYQCKECGYSFTLKESE